MPTCFRATIALAKKGIWNWILAKKLKFSTIVGLVLIVLGIMLAVGLYFAREYAKVGSGYLARQMCMCVYVQNRDEALCRKDLRQSTGKSFDLARFVYLARQTPFEDSSNESGTVILDDQSIIVDFMGLGAAQASLKPGFGCSVRNFNGVVPAGLNLENQQ